MATQTEKFFTENTLSANGKICSHLVKNPKEDWRMRVSYVKDDQTEREVALIENYIQPFHILNKLFCSRGFLLR